MLQKCAMYKNQNYIPTIFEVNALCKCNDFSRSLGTSVIFFFFFYKMTPVLLQGTVWGYAALCDSSSFHLSLCGHAPSALTGTFFFFQSLFLELYLLTKIKHLDSTYSKAFADKNLNVHL